MSEAERELLRSAREHGICPRCKNGNGRVWDGAGSRTDCSACRGLGTWDAYKLEREFVKGWNAALDRCKREYTWAYKDLP